MNEGLEQANSKSVLLVDDDEAHLLWSQEILRDEGYLIVATHSALEALNLLKERSFDLVISDLIMPEMTGTEFVAKAAELRKGLKAIILTGHGDIDSFIQSMYGLGTIEYIIKPVEIPELINMVRKLLSEPGAGSAPA